MSLSSIVASLLLSFTLWQAPTPPPPPYGLPNGATLGSDTTASDGTRTITYTSQGNTVVVEIDLAGHTTETTTDPDGKETVRTYETLFNGDGTRTEVKDEGAGRTTRRTIGATGQRVKVETIHEVPRKDASETIDREIRTTEYHSNGRRSSVTVVKEEEVPTGDGRRLPRKRTTHTETWDAAGNKTSVMDEHIELVDEQNGVPIHAGTRTTRTRDPQTGKPGPPVVEVYDQNTNTWGPQPPPAAPEPEPESDDMSEGPARRAGYVALSPGIIHIALPNAVGYQWGARGGVEFPCGGPCAIAAGLGFQHSVASAHAHELRTQAEAMPGARLLDDRLFVFGVVALGHVANVSSFEFMGETNRSTNHGVALGLGAGVSYAVWRELFVGGRFGADLQWFPSSSGTFDAHHLALDAFLGWRFGF
jgi:hypothetical protein